MLPVKVIWDYAFYWGVLAQFFFQGRVADLSAMASLREELALCQKLNLAVQALLREWSAVSEKRNPAVMIDQASIPWFTELNRSLNDTLDDAQFRARLRQGALQLQALAHEIVERACAGYPQLDGGTWRARVKACGGLGASAGKAAVLPSPALLAELA